MRLTRARRRRRRRRRKGRDDVFYAAGARGCVRVGPGYENFTKHRGVKVCYIRDNVSLEFFVDMDILNFSANQTQIVTNFAILTVTTNNRIVPFFANIAVFLPDQIGPIRINCTSSSHY